MSIEFAGYLYSGAGQKGKSLLVGVGQEHRYSPYGLTDLASAGVAAVGSLELITTAAAAGHLAFFLFPSYTGPFVQFSDVASAGDAFWNFTSLPQNVLLTASDRQGHNETRLSFRDQFLQQWIKILDGLLQGQSVARQGDPTLTWEMFPTFAPSLDPNLAYLKIYQPLSVSTPWPWGTYAASMTYWVELYINGDGHIRAYGARWAYWVQSGAKSSHIGSELQPHVQQGLGTLETQINQQLAILDGLGTLSDVYYLPGRQLEPTVTGSLSGNTDDDVTIVIEH